VIVIAHDPPPRDAAFMMVTLRRAGARPALWRGLLDPPSSQVIRRNLTRLSFVCSPNPAPNLDLALRYCVSLAVYDAAGNGSGNETEVCGAVIDCREHVDVPTAECTAEDSGVMPFAEPELPHLKDSGLADCLWGRLRVASTALLASLGLLVGWRKRRDRQAGAA
jgi:hypothetical protein